MSNQQEGRFYDFGPFRLDLTERLLLRDGEVVPLTPKAFDTLLALVQSGGHILEKDELMRSIWPDSFVEEVNLAHHISTLRKALGEGRNGEQYIQTVPRRGYRFIAKVSPLIQESCTDEAIALNSPQPVLKPGVLSVTTHELKPGRRRVWGAMLLLLLLAVGLGLWSIRRKREVPVPLTAIPFTSYVGSEYQPSFSPDGNQVAFSWNGEQQDNFDIYVKLIGTSTPLRLTRHPGADWSPAWSPDGRSIAFLRILTEGFALMTVPPLGGPEQKLLEIQGRAGGYFRGPYLAWSLDGKAIVFSYRESPNQPTGLFLLSLENREKTRLTSPPAGSIGDSAPAFSPDGHSLAFNRIMGVGTSELYLLSLSGNIKPVGEPKRITFGGRDAYSPAWSPDGSEIIYASVPGLWRVAIDSIDRPERLAWVGENGDFPAISRQGHRLAYSRSLNDFNIWRVELPDSHGPTGHPQRFIASTFTDAEPQFSPDGTRIVFSSDRSGNDEIWVCDSDGSNAFQLTSLGSPRGGDPRWSPDGQRIAFAANVGGQFDIHIIDADGGKPRRLTSSPHNFVPSWSHDGKWLYFASTRSGEKQVWKMPAEGGEAVQVTRQGGFLALESTDGNTLYYLKSEDKDHESFSTSLWKVPAQGGEETQVIESVAARAFTVVKDGIYFVPRRNPGSTTRSIQFLDFTTGKTRLVVTVEMPVAYGLSVSPDGKWMLFPQIDQLGSDIMLVENFR